MKRRILIGALIAVCATVAGAQDVRVVLGESLVNKFLAAVGEVKKTEPFTAFGMSGEYTWSVKNPKLQILKDKVRFQSGASIDVKGFKYDTEAVGDVEVKYDAQTNKIKIKILKTAIKIYVEVFGQRKDISEIDISKYYNFQFEFAGPQPFQTSTEITLPDGSKRTISASISPALVLEPGQIVVGAGIAFATKK